MKATALMGNDGDPAAPSAGTNGIKPVKPAKGKLKQVKKPAAAVNALAGGAEPALTSSPMSDYDKDPDKGERPYKDHEVESMRDHVVKAMEIIHHPHKSKAVAGHFKKQKMHAKNFNDLKAHISQEMDAG